MNTIQELIIEMTARKKSHIDNWENEKWLQNDTQYHQGRIDECDFLITKLMLLLSNKPTEAITGSAHSANTLLGERAASETDQSIGGGGAEHSETAIVGQNEQTKEVCQHAHLITEYIGQNYGTCVECGSTVFR